MAKWGEGDPRWIVEERADATNVNNWHWTERDATNWSSDKLKSLLLGLSVANDEGSCEVTEVSKLEGEASINNRKGKLIFFYEWNLKATWIGKSNAGVKYKGSVEVPNLSDENDTDDLDITVMLDKDEPDTPLLKLMKTQGAEKVREALGSYVGYLKTDLIFAKDSKAVFRQMFGNICSQFDRVFNQSCIFRHATFFGALPFGCFQTARKFMGGGELQPEFTQGMILPTANGVAKLQSTSQSKAKFNKSEFHSTSSTATPTSTGVKIPTCKLTLKDTFLTSPADLYRVFLNQEMVQAFTRSSATVEGEKGGKFRLLEGNVFGEFTELVPDEKIVMKWRFNNWPCEHYATITLTFLDRSTETELKVECRGVPNSEEEQTKQGWKRYYFEAIKQTFGYGARLF